MLSQNLLEFVWQGFAARLLLALRKSSAAVKDTSEKGAGSGRQVSQQTPLVASGLSWWRE